MHEKINEDKKLKKIYLEYAKNISINLRRSLSII